MKPNPSRMTRLHYDLVAAWQAQPERALDTIRSLPAEDIEQLLLLHTGAAAYRETL